MKRRRFNIPLGDGPVDLRRIAIALRQEDGTAAEMELSETSLIVTLPYGPNSSMFHGMRRTEIMAEVNPAPHLHVEVTFYTRNFIVGPICILLGLPGLPSGIDQTLSYLLLAGGFVIGPGAYAWYHFNVRKLREFLIAQVAPGT